MIKLSILLVAISLLLPSEARSQTPALAVAPTQEDLVIERDQVLTRDGRVEREDRLLSIGYKTGNIPSQRIGKSGGKSLRIHFDVLPPTQGRAWNIHVLNSSKKIVWSYTPETEGETEFWSDELPGDFFTVTISSTDDSPTRILIDKIAIATPVSKPQGIVGDNDLKKIAEIQDPDLKRLVIEWGNAVARLRFIGDNGKRYRCTGFLITSELLLTNYHCISTETEMYSALVDFDYNTENDAPTNLRFSEMVASNRALDFSILRLVRRQPSARRPLSLDERAPADNSPLILIQHPGGEVKQVVWINCNVKGTGIMGSGTFSDFGHECDTLGSSSGSPVQDPVTGKVIGLHHLGYKSGSRLLVNQAVNIGQILDFIRTKKPRVFSELSSN